MSPRTEPITVAERQQQRIDSLPEAISELQLQRVSTGRVRYALSQLAQNNVVKVQEWLDNVALVDGPAKALELYLKMLEYSVPKLTRTEVKIEDSAGNTALAALSVEDLQEMVAQGVARQARTIEGVATAVPEET
jgi:hypothetical protein